MKRKLLHLFFYCILLLSVDVAVAQEVDTQPASVLKERIKNGKDDTTKVKLLLALSRKLLFKSGANQQDLDSANILMKQAQFLSAGLHNSKWQGRTSLMATLLYNRAGQRDKGWAENQKALTIFQKIGDLPDQGEAYILLGQHYGNAGKEMENKLHYYKTAADIFVKTGRTERAAATLKDIGDLQSLISDLPESLKSLQASLVLYKSINYQDMQGLYDLMGYVLSRMGDYTDGLKYGLLAVKTAEAMKDTSLQLCTIYNRVGLTYGVLEQYDNCRIYRSKALAIAKKYRDTASMTVISFNIMATYFVTHQYKNAEKILKEVDRYSKNRSQELDLQIKYAYLKLYLAVKKPALAKLYFNQVKSFEGKIVDAPELDEIRLRGTIWYYQDTGQWDKTYQYIKQHEILCRDKNLSIFSYPEQNWYFKADSALKKYPSAIKHYQRFKAVNDSVFNEKKIKQTEVLKIQYETDEKDNELLLKAKDIQLLVKQNELQRVQSQQVKVTRNLTFIGTAMLILLLIVGYNRFRLKQRSNVLLKNQQVEINKQNHALQVLNQKQKSLIKEKEWLLREIHHRVKNNLQITMSLLSMQSAYMLNNDALEAIQNSQRRMQAMSLIHQKLYQSENLALIDMSEYIKELVLYIKESFDEKRSVQFDMDTPHLELDIAQAVPLGLIINEAITNSIKYAFPGRNGGKICIALKEDVNGIYRLTVADNGIGLPDNFAPESHNSLGLNLMRGLADQLQGEITIQSNLGTIITVTFESVNLMNEELYTIEMEEA